VREVPAILTPALRERTRQVLTANRRTPVGHDGKPARGRRYLLSGLIRCAVCGSRCTAHSVTNGGKRWRYYACNDNRSGERPARGPKGHARFVPARWLEEVVWADVRSFLENPGEVLHRVREELVGAEDTQELEHRHADLARGSPQSTRSGAATSGFAPRATSARRSWRATSWTSEPRRTI
jgi:hypothetical protein